MDTPRQISDSSCLCYRCICSHERYFFKQLFTACSNRTYDHYCAEQYCYFFIILLIALQTIMNYAQYTIIGISLLTSLAATLPGIFLMLRCVALLSDAISHSILSGMVL